MHAPFVWLLHLWWLVLPGGCNIFTSGLKRGASYASSTYADWHVFVCVGVGHPFDTEQTACGGLNVAYGCHRSRQWPS